MYSLYKISVYYVYEPLIKLCQNHASFLHLLDDGALLCCWFGGTLEGRSDISIFASVLMPGAEGWGPAQRLSHDPDHSEQNPVVFRAPDGRLWLFHTSQPAGNQDECRVRMAELSRDPADPSRVLAVVPVRAGGVATSGTAHRGAHVRDARTGRAPVGLRSVTVVAATLTWADLDATSAFALGPDALAWLRTRPGRTGLVVAADGRAIPFTGPPARG